MRNFIRRILTGIITRRLVNRFIERMTGRAVVSGPFSGMKYVNSSIDSMYYPKLLGTYELELSPIIERLCKEQFDIIVNAGAGEGYYAVGMAMRNPGASIVAFETDSYGRELIKEMARINKVNDRVTVHSLCDAPALSKALSDSTKRPLLIMDIEGGESILLDPFVVPSLSRLHILVELHDSVFEIVGAVIVQRFKDSHNITEIWSKNRALGDFPIRLSNRYPPIVKQCFVDAMNEHRPGQMRWFYLEPRP